MVLPERPTPPATDIDADHQLPKKLAPGSFNTLSMEDLLTLPPFLSQEQKPAEEKKKDKADDKEPAVQEYRGCLGRFFKAYCDEFRKKDTDNDDTKKDDDTKKNNGNDDAKKDNGNGDAKKDNGDTKKDDDSTSKRRALPAPFRSPPFPSGEYQGYPLIGVPYSTTKYPLQKALDGTNTGNFLDNNRIYIYGWLNASVNFSTNRVTNTPTSYWVVPNSLQLDQALLRVERPVDTVQTDHIDWGFRATGDFGIDYRYFTAGGWFSRQLLVHNNLYGWDPTELHTHTYFPGIFEGMIITFGRWVATPDIETQFAPDNYMGTHSLLFTVDVYTETGIMATVMLNEQWTVQAALHAGADMAPWYPGAMPTGMFGARWVSEDNNDSFYTVLNALNNAHFRYFTLDGQPGGHHNYNIIQTTWQHRINETCVTKTEAYYMWEFDAAVGGTPSIGPPRFGLGGGLGPTVPGLSQTYGVLNFTVFQVSKKDFFTVRNEWMYDEHGTRYGFAGNYSSHALGWTHNFNSLLQIRPEIGYYRNYTNPTFDNGQHFGMFMAGFDMTLRF